MKEGDPNNWDATHHYVVPPPTRCHACTATLQAQGPYFDPESGSDNPHALHFGAYKQAGPRRARPTTVPTL